MAGAAAVDPGDAAAPAAAGADGFGPVLVRLLAVLDPALAAERARRLSAAFDSLAAIVAAPPARLAALVGADAAELLAAHRQAALWTLREPAVRGPIAATRYELIDYLHARLARDRDETLLCFFLNRRRELLAEEVVARGGPDGVAAEPRLILARALELGATGLVLVHNHPSGDPSPSLADRRFTRRLAAAGEALGVVLHDHLVVARDGCRLVASAEA